MFPAGEQFFIDSVRHYQDKIADADLRTDMLGFIAQEAMHSKQHDLCNRQLKARSPKLARSEQFAAMLLNHARTHYPARFQLAITCALEHFTAIFANTLLIMQAFPKHAHPSYAKLWLWHAVEETEHKAVCYDIYQYVTGGGWLSYIERCLAMLMVSACFLAAIIYAVCAMGGQPAPNDKPAAASPKSRGLLAGLPALLFFKGGIIRELMLPYFAYYLPCFHPWQHDNSALLEDWLQQFESGYFADTPAKPETAGQI